MNENGEILKSLGELTGLVKASRGDIATLSGKHDKLAESTQAIATAVQVMQTGYNAKAIACTREFEEINKKLGRDFDTINELKTKTVVDAGVDAYKGNRRIWWQWALGIIGGVLCVITGINQLTGVIDKFQASKAGAPSVYASTLIPRVDSTKSVTPRKDSTFVINTDTIRGK